MNKFRIPELSGALIANETYLQSQYTYLYEFVSMSHSLSKII